MFNQLPFCTSEYAAVCTLTKEDPPATKGTVIEQFKLVTERDS